MYEEFRILRGQGKVKLKSHVVTPLVGTPLTREIKRLHFTEIYRSRAILLRIQVITVSPRNIHHSKAVGVG